MKKIGHILFVAGGIMFLAGALFYWQFKLQHWPYQTFWKVIMIAGPVIATIGHIIQQKQERKSPEDQTKASEEPLNSE